MLLMRDRKKMSIFESALADGTPAARSPERETRHIPFRWQLSKKLHRLPMHWKGMVRMTLDEMRGGLLRVKGRYSRLPPARSEAHSIADGILRRSEPSQSANSGHWQDRDS